MSNLSELLLQEALLPQAELSRAEALSSQRGERLAAILSQLGLVVDEDMASLLQRATGLPLVIESDFPEDLPPITGINYGWLMRRAILPLYADETGLHIAMADPGDEAAIEALAFAAGRAVHPSIANRSDILDRLARHDGRDESPGSNESDIARELEAFADIGSEAPIIRLVDRLLASAAKRRASDVHIEPMARQIIVRFRIDGALREMERHPLSLASSIATRIKVMAGLDISESRLPQDGRLRVTVGGHQTDVRVSTSPTAHGESIVMRLLGQSEVPLDLDRLGIGAPALAQLRAALARPHGIILLTGPTGSGKTTTLYAALAHLRRPDVKILTVEDPVEILLDGVNQVQVQPEIDLSYARALRAFLRQDPDILMVGEIRDRETADIALRAALTGHLVLSTLHTNSALGAFTRLHDIGIEPFLTASTVIATIAQRLVRTLCHDCAAWREPDSAMRQLYADAGLPAPDRLGEAWGCDKCQQTGYRGRAPLFEIVTMNDELRGLVRANAADHCAIPPAASLHGHGLALVTEGRTTLTEVERVVSLV